MTPDDIITRIEEREGGSRFTDRANDRGGATKFGITLRTLRYARGAPHLSANDVKNLTEAEARAIYLKLYIVKPRFDLIANERLRFEVIDAGVLHGIGWAARRLQEVAGVTADGLVGPITLGAVNATNRDLFEHFVARRCRRVVKLALADHSQLDNLNGWINRSTMSLLEDPQ